MENLGDLYGTTVISQIQREANVAYFIIENLKEKYGGKFENIPKKEIVKGFRKRGLGSYLYDCCNIMQ